MSWIIRCWHNLLRRDAVDRDLDDELRATLRMLVDERVRAGMSQPDALRAARLAMGSVDAITEGVRDERVGVRVETLLVDLRYGARLLRRSPAFALTATLSLAIGIGASTAAFSVWNAVLLRSLDVRDPDHLVVVSTRNAGSRYSMSYPSFTYLRDQVSSLDGLAAFRATPLNVSVRATTERVTGTLVSGNYFGVLGVEMALGSPILPEDDLTPGSGGPRGLVAVLSHQFWRDRMGADVEAIGRAIRVNGHPATIVGVTPPRFHGTTRGSMPSVFVPMMFAPHVFDAPNWLTNPRNLWLRMIGRLDDSATAAQAQAESTLAFRRFHRDIVVPIAQTDSAWRRARDAMIVLQPGHAGLLELGDTVRPALFSVLGLVGLVMVTACINVAGLMVARAERLHRDTAISLALGATRARVWSRTLAESLLVGAMGVGLGLAMAVSMRQALVQLVGAGVDFDVALDARALTVAVLLGLVSTLAVSVVTAWSRTRFDVARALKGEDLSARLWLRKGLIVAQLAVSIVVLVAAALFVQTLNTLRVVDPGFARERLLIASIATSGYRPQQRRAFYERLLEDVRQIPGVVSAALGSHEPLGVTTGWNILVPRGPRGEPEAASASVDFVSPGYFETMGIALRRGRDFEPRDVGHASNPVIVNERFVREYVGAGDPVGRLVTANGNMTFEIVGVVRDSASEGLRDLPQPMIYLPGGSGVLHVRAAIAPNVLRSAIEDRVHRLDPDAPVFNVRTIEQQLDRVLLRERTFAVLSATFGSLALVLAAVGLYGVVASSVSRRTKELGIRLALGAGPRRIVQLVLSEAGRLLLLGVAVGVPCAVAIGRAIRQQLFGVEPWNALSIAAAVAALIAVAGVAAGVPARRAARVDPLVALRSE